MEENNEIILLIDILKSNDLKEYTEEIKNFRLKLTNLLTDKIPKNPIGITLKIEENKNKILGKKRKRNITPILSDSNNEDMIENKLKLLIGEKKINPIIEKRRKANHFYLIYKHNDKNLIRNVLMERFRDFEIIFCYNREKNKYVEILIYFKKQQNLYLKHPMLRIEGKIPYLLSTKEPTKSKFKLIKSQKAPMFKDKFDWIKKDLPLLHKGESSESYNNCLSKTGNDKLYRNLYKILIKNDNSVLNNFCHNFKVEIERMGIKILNEILCHFILLKNIEKINKKKNIINLIAVDYNFSEIFEGKKRFFKPDLILTIKNRLIIIEFKYRLDRLDQKLDSLKCIHYKQYAPRLINYFQENKMDDIIDKIDEVMLIGISFTNRDKITCGIIYELYEKNVFENSDYKTLKFYETMKLMKRRFKNL